MANQVYFHLSGNLIFFPSCSVHPWVLFSWLPPTLDSKSINRWSKNTYHGFAFGFFSLFQLIAVEGQSNSFVQREQDVSSISSQWQEPSSGWRETPCTREGARTVLRSSGTLAGHRKNKRQLDKLNCWFPLSIGWICCWLRKRMFQLRFALFLGHL